MTRPRFVVEVAGPAGAGKSTVSHLLAERSEVVSASIWGLPRPLYAASALRVLPAIGALVGAARWLPWEDTEQLIRLDALDVFLDRLQSLVVLDEGPVFAFAWFRVLGHPCFRDGRRDAWWRRTLTHWAGRLDAIVVLDGADPLLVERLRTRAKEHPLKQSSDQELYEFAAAYRRAFDWVIAGMTAAGGGGGTNPQGHRAGEQRRCARGAGGPGIGRVPGDRACRVTCSPLPRRSRCPSPRR